jgi:hypothetical protein
MCCAGRLVKALNYAYTPSFDASQRSRLLSVPIPLCVHSCQLQLSPSRY